MAVESGGTGSSCLSSSAAEIGLIFGAFKPPGSSLSCSAKPHLVFELVVQFISFHDRLGEIGPDDKQQSSSTENQIPIYLQGYFKRLSGKHLRHQNQAFL